MHKRKKSQKATPKPKQAKGASKDENSTSNKKKIFDNESEAITELTINENSRRGRGKKQVGKREYVDTSNMTKKELKKLRKSRKPHAEIVQKANAAFFGTKIARTQKKSQIHKMEEVLNTCKGKMREVCVKPDTSRILQRVIKYGNKTQRDLIYNELSGEMIRLCQNRTAHHLILKLVQYGTPEMKQKILEEVSRNMVKLSLHTYAAEVIDQLYATGTPKQKFEIVQHFYGPEFQILKRTKSDMDQIEDLKSFFKICSPTEKQAVLSNLENHIERVMDKQMAMFRYMHSLVWDFLVYSSKEARQKIISEVAKAPLGFHNTQQGVNIIIYCLAYGTVADRKSILKLLKGAAEWLGFHNEAYRVLLRALDIVDDTANLQKMVLVGLTGKKKTVALKESLNQITYLSVMKDKYASKLLLHIFSPQNPSYFSQQELDLSFLKEIEAKSGDEETKKEKKEKKEKKSKKEDTESKRGASAPFTSGSFTSTFSKKPPQQRRLELLKYVLLDLLTTCEQHANALLRDLNGSRVLYEALREACSKLSATDELDEGEREKLERAVDGVFKAIAALGQLPYVAVAPKKFEKKKKKKKDEQKEASDSEGDDEKKAKGEGEEEEVLTPQKEAKEPQCHIFEDFIGHYALKRLLLHLPVEYGSKLALLLIEATLPQVQILAETNRGAFLVSTMIEKLDLKDKDHKKQVSNIRQALKPNLERFAQQPQHPSKPQKKAAKKKKRKGEEGEDESGGVAPGIRVLMEQLQNTKSK